MSNRKWEKPNRSPSGVFAIKYQAESSVNSSSFCESFQTQELWMYFSCMFCFVRLNAHSLTSSSKSVTRCTLSSAPSPFLLNLRKTGKGSKGSVSLFALSTAAFEILNFCCSSLRCSRFSLPFVLFFL